MGKQALALYRIGPFRTRTEAENAMQTLKERSIDWDKEEQQED